MTRRLAPSLAPAGFTVLFARSATLAVLGLTQPFWMRNVHARFSAPDPMHHHSYCCDGGFNLGSSAEAFPNSSALSVFSPLRRKAMLN